VTTKLISQYNSEMKNYFHVLFSKLQNVLTSHSLDKQSAEFSANLQK